VGLLTAYLVITGFVTVRPARAASRRLDLGLMLVVLSLAVTLFTFGFEVLASPTGKRYGMPAFPFLIFGSIALLASVGDFRLIRLGGVQTIRGASRLARHLWRMSTPVVMAAFPFSRPGWDILKPLHRSLPAIPLLVVLALIYWPWRVAPGGTHACRRRRRVSGRNAALGARVMYDDPLRRDGGVYGVNFAGLIFGSPLPSSILLIFGSSI
jgi:hypothetical protein